MKQRLSSILGHMTARDSKYGVKSFQEGDPWFEVSTGLDQFGHNLSMRAEATPDGELFRIELRDVFGEIDVRLEPHVAAGQLLKMMADNTGSFQTTTCFLGTARQEQDKFLATLNSFHHFVSAWDDADIARALDLHLFDLTMGLVSHDPTMTMLKRFGGS